MEKCIKIKNLTKGMVTLFYHQFILEGKELILPFEVYRQFSERIRRLKEANLISYSFIDKDTNEVVLADLPKKEEVDQEYIRGNEFTESSFLGGETSMATKAILPSQEEPLSPLIRKKDIKENTI